MKKKPFNWKSYGIGIIAIGGLGGLFWLIGALTHWTWSDFWSNFISNAASSGVIGFILYWIITRPDERKSREERKNQALAMLKVEFETNLSRAQAYLSVLEDPNIEKISALYPFRFTRGAWNALKESGFLPQVEDVQLVYELLRVNEIILVANRSLSKVRTAAIDNQPRKLQTYSVKALRECAQLVEMLTVILKGLNALGLPQVSMAMLAESEDEEEEA